MIPKFIFIINILLIVELFNQNQAFFNAHIYTFESIMKGNGTIFLGD